MKTTILITGSTDGIGFETAKRLVSAGHEVLVHGRSQAKIDQALGALAALQNGARPRGYLADLSDLAAVRAFAEQVKSDCPRLDVLINNAGVFKVPQTKTADGLDVRFVVNSIAPYALTEQLLPLLGAQGRVINLSSAAQAPVDLRALRGEVDLTDSAAYAQSKLALTMWSRHLATTLGVQAPTMIAVNPGSFLGTKMVKGAYGVAGNDIGMGAEVLSRAALSEEFGEESGRYYDNDAGRFAEPHPDALDSNKSAAVVEAIESVLNPYAKR